MNWDEKADRTSMSIFFDAPPTALQTRLVVPFRVGARWQREQLRTDEAIERVALMLISAEGEEGWPTNEELGGNPTGDRDVEYRDAWLEGAKEVINALLGED